LKCWTGLQRGWLAIRSDARLKPFSWCSKDGGYTFADFARVGLPLTILIGIVVLMVAPTAYNY
jgi:hypothetical protein